MANVAASADKATDLLQKLSLDSDAKIIDVSDASKKSGPILSTGPVNGMAKPLNPNACFFPNGYPSPAYYFEIDKAVGVYGDSCPYMYPQGYGFAPYGPYPPPNSSIPTMQHDGVPYGLQQYQYPSPYYQSPASAEGPYAPNQMSAPQGEISPSITADHNPSSFLTNKENTNTMVNGDCTKKNGIKVLLTSSQNSSLSPNDSYEEGNFPTYQVSRFGTNGTQSTVPLDASLFSDRQYKHGGKVGLPSSVMPAKDFSSLRNQNHCQPLPQFMNLHGYIPSSGLEMVSGFMSRMYPSNRMYNQYGNAVRACSHFGSAVYGSRPGSINNKLKATSNGYGSFYYGKRNMDGLNELNRGPRAKFSDNKSVGLEQDTLLPKGQNLLPKNDADEVPLIPSKEEYNGNDFSETYADAKFYVIKSYSEDDIHKSIKYSVWASTPNGNKKLNTAYQDAKEKQGGCPIFLLFSVNTSGQFVGLAEMVGPVDFDRTVEYWQQDKWTGCFSVKWHIIKDIPNGVLRHVTLENNENKPVTNSRDTQEVKFEQGIQIIKIFKEYSSKTCILDDFRFYEAREKTIQERKSKEQLFQKQVSKPSDLTTITKSELHKSIDGALITGSVTPDAAAAVEVRVNAEVKLSEENGTTAAA